MEKYASEHAQPETALTAIIEESIAESGPEFGTLTSKDHDAIALHLASVAGVRDRFRKEREDHSLAEAFYRAFTKSEDWEMHVESEERLKRSLARLARSYTSVFHDFGLSGSLFRELDRQSRLVRQSAESALALNERLRFNVESFGSAAIQVNERWNELAKIREEVLGRIQEWERIAASFRSVHDVTARIAKRRAELTQAVERIGHVQPLVAPIVDLASSFADVSTRLISVSSISTDLLSTVNERLFESTALTLRTNDFFATRFADRRFFEFEPKAHYLPEQAVEQEEEIDAALDDAELILHAETAVVIAEGSCIAERIRDVVSDEISSKLKPFEAILRRLNQLATPTSFLEFLKEFALVAARDYWNSLWVDPGNKWQPRPERHAQAMLGMFLQGRWSGLGFVGREIANGDGFVDILVNFMAKDYVVELKMVGAGWPISHAESGLTQLERYMANFVSQEAFLVVFDGRKTSKGRSLPELHDTPYGPIHVIVVPAFFDAPSSR